MVKYTIESQGGSIKAGSTPVKAIAERGAAQLANHFPGQEIVVYRNGKRMSSWTCGPKADQQV